MRVLLSLIFVATLVMASAAQVSVRMDSHFNLGETINFAVINNSNTTYILRRPVPEIIYQNNTPVYPTDVTQLYLPIAPHTTQLFSWDQHDSFGLQVPAGNYLLKLRVYSAPGIVNQTLTQAFTIR